MKFKRCGDMLLPVTTTSTKEPVEHKPKKYKNLIFKAILILGSVTVLFVLDGGSGVLSAGLIEAFKWVNKNQEAIQAYLMF